MRILFVSHYALPHTGGVEVIIDNIARSLVQLGHEVVHIASRSAENQRREFRPPYSQILVPASQILHDWTSVPYPLFAPRRLWRDLRERVQAADVIHAHGMLYMSTVAAFEVDRRLGRQRRVLTEHVGHVPYGSRIVDAAERAAIATIGRFTLRRANAVITYNTRVAAELAALSPGVSPTHIPNGVDTALFRPPQPGEREVLRESLGWDHAPRVLFAGRLVEKKGVPALIEAARLAGETIQFVLAGPGHVANAPGNVQCLGNLPPSRLAELYRAADAYLLPSRGEGFPLTVQEAMASGLPAVLGSDPGYLSTLAGAARAFRMVDPSPQAIVTALRDLIADREGAGAAAAAFMEQHGGWTAAALAHLDVYEQILRRDRA